MRAKRLVANVCSACRRWLSPTLFALIVLCFVLPFATVSCDNTETTFTGIQLATWSVPSGGSVDEPDCSADISTCVERKESLTGFVALVAAVVGFGLGVLGVTKGPGWCAATNLGALIALAVGAAGDMFGPDVTFGRGYKAALVLSVSALALHAWTATRRRRHARQLGAADVGNP